MAVSIGPQIKVDGEKGYKDALKSIIQSTKTLDAQMKKCAASFDKNGSSIKKSKEMHDLLLKKQTQLKEKVKTLKKAVEDSTKAEEENKEQTERWAEKLAKAETELIKVNKELENTDPSKAWAEAISNMGNKLQDIGSVIKDVGSDLTAKVTLPIVGMATASVKTAADFDTAMSQVQATMGITVDAMSNLNGKSVNTISSLRDLAKEMGSKTAFSASECAEAINYLALAGYDTQKIFDTLPTVLNLAAAGGMELGRASDMVTDAMSALGMEAKDASKMVDQMASTASHSNTSVSQLGDAILQIGGTAKSMAGGTIELSTALGILANNGIKGAEGGTHLRNVIMSLQNPTSKAATWMEKLNLNVYDATGNMRPLNDILKDLNESTKEMTQEERTAVISKLFNKTDIAAVSALLSDCGVAWDGLAASIADSSGAAEAMADTQLDNLNGQLTKLKSALEGAAISIGEKLMPYISGMVEKVQQAVNWFNSLDKSQLDVIIRIAGIVAAVGPLLVVIGSMVSGIGSAMVAFSAMIPVAGALGISVGALAGIVAAVPVAIAAVIAAGVYLATHWDELKEKAHAFADGISGAMESARQRTAEQFDAIKERVSNAMNSVKNSVQNAVDAVKRIFNTKLEFPKIKLPHFSITGSLSLNPPSVPKLSVDWYKRGYAESMMFDSPTVLPTAGGLKGFGDGNGREYVVGESHLADVIGSTVSSVMAASMSGIHGLLEQYLPECANSSIYLDGDALVGATVNKMNATLGRIAYKEGRGY